MKAHAPSVLFADQSGELGGAELSLLDIVDARDARTEVCLLGDGPFADRLRGIGVAVTVIPLGPAASVRRDGKGASLVRILPSLLSPVLKFAAKAKTFDIIYANTMKAFIIAAVSRPIHGRPIIWHLRDLLTPEHVSRGLRRLCIVLARLFIRHVVANSQATADAFVYEGGRPGRVTVIYNGIDPAPFDVIDPIRARVALCRECDFSPEIPIVGVFSRLAEWKGQHVLLEAMRQQPGFQAVIVGGPLFGETAFEGRLAALIADYGLTDRVRLLGFRSDIPALMKGVDIVLHTSTLAEPFGRVIVEGMLAGKPVIATRAGGAIELIDDDVTGVLIPPGESAALGNAIAHLIADPIRTARLSAAGSIHARDKFGVSRLREQLEALLKRFR